MGRDLNLSCAALELGWTLSTMMLGHDQHDRLSPLGTFPLFEFATASEGDFAQVVTAMDGRQMARQRLTGSAGSFRGFEFSGDFQFPLRVAVNQRDGQMTLWFGNFDQLVQKLVNRLLRLRIGRLARNFIQIDFCTECQPLNGR